MNCEEFEILGLDSQRDGSIGNDGRERAVPHARGWARCAALGASWTAAQVDLAALAESSRILHVPARVEARVLQQFRLKHQPRQERRFLLLASWGLAAAAVIVCTLGGWDRHKWPQGSLGGNIAASQAAALDADSGHPTGTSGISDSAVGDDSEILMADN